LQPSADPGDGGRALAPRGTLSVSILMVLIDLNLAKMPRAGIIGLLPIHPRLASAGQPAEHGQ
jgi:hypothetical protein